MMSQEITPGHFEEFFRALNQKSSGEPLRPFLWQQRLAEEVCAGDWPRTLALPTASGKTACIDIAVFALACQATRKPAERTAPRRIFFVVDRRVIVDQAYRRARLIAKCLQSEVGADGKHHEILKRVAKNLRRLGGLDRREPPLDPPLLCGQLRGGIYRDQTWARTPTQPTILASTVDQIGSRLLFRGYGLSDSLRPIHAGLAGNDALILLDEAHCSNPFRQTLEAVHDYRKGSAEAGLNLPFQFAILSATPTDEEGEASLERTFRLRPDERADERLAPRLRARKPTRLGSVAVSGKEKGRRGAFAARLVEEAELMVDRQGLQAVAIFVNRVATAREVEEILRERRPNDRDHVVLMTGRMRSIDRDRLLDEWDGHLRADRKLTIDRPIFVVATQCLEVGADFDFDGVVTECAGLDALRQRFGRLNRLGMREGARGAILIRADQVVLDDQLDDLDDKEKDPIYGTALPATWNWLQAHAGPKADGEADEIDLGVDAFDALLPTDLQERSQLLRRLQAPAPDAPVMLPSHVDCLVQTSPSPDPDPKISLFLHGPDEGDTAVQVCWRADLDPKDSERWADILSLCPPTAPECMPVPLAALRRWLSGEDEPDDSGDLESPSTSASEGGDETPATPPMALVWRGPKDDGTMRIKEGRDVRPGDTVVIVAGRDEALAVMGSLGQVPRIGQDLDLGEEAFIRSRRRAILRLHPRRMDPWGSIPSLARLRAMACDTESPPPDHVRGDWRDALEELDLESLETEGAPAWLREVIVGLKSKDAGRVKILIHPDHPSLAKADMAESELAAKYPGGVILVGSGRFELASGEIESESRDTQTTDGDEGSIGEIVTLEDHTRGVVARVANFADALGLAPDLRDALVTAAEWHDLGKLDGRFQRWLNGGKGLPPVPLAKGLNLGREAREKARERSGYPKGCRHELASAGLAEQLATEADRDLILHLIASHHGHARPWAPVVEDDAPVDLTAQPMGLDVQTSSKTDFHRLGSGAAERFWRLTRHYGWWGLAWLESILRLADHRQSEAEQGEREDEARREAPPIWQAPPVSHRPASADREFILVGPDGGNPLGFLVTLGILRTLADAWPDRQVRMSWKLAGAWRPVLHLNGDADPAEIVRALDGHLKRMRGDELWRIGPDLTLTPEVFRRATRAARAQVRQTGDRTRADFLAAFGCESTTLDRPNGPPIIQDTALRTMSGAGHQHFILSMSLIVDRTGPEHLDKALFHPWRYDDAVEKQTLRWDPADDVRRALRWRDPSGDPGRKRRGGMLGANRLAIEGLPLLPTIPVGRSLRTTGFSGKGAGTTSWTWPIWSEPLGPDVVRSLMAHPALSGPRGPDVDHLAAIGVAEIYRSRRLTVDKFRSFTPARPI